MIAHAVAPPALKVRVKSTTIEMPLEQYVAAVLAGECSTFRSDEAIKAMAVAVRSYALNLRGRHAAQGYDLCTSTHCQRLDPDAVTPRLASLAAGNSRRVAVVRRQAGVCLLLAPLRRKYRGRCCCLGWPARAIPAQS